VNFETIQESPNVTNAARPRRQPDRRRVQPANLAFLRSLERNNHREWFPRAQGPLREMRAPMVALIEQLAADFRDFAPELQ
jgi:uncharacterized protein (DUF2461 family)